MKEQAKKIILVVFLTLIIWAWAYFADEEVMDQTVMLDISPVTSKELLVSFDRPTPITFEKIGLKGPAAKISELRGKLLSNDPQQKENLDFYLNVEQEKKENLKSYSLDVIEFIKNSDKMRTLGLTVEPVEIDPVEVTIEKLTKRRLTIQVLNKDGGTLTPKSIDPAGTIEMFVHTDWPQDKLKATVVLTDSQIAKARRDYVTVTPVVELNNGQKREAGYVNITLPPTAKPLMDRSLQPRIGFMLSQALQGKYIIELINEEELTDTTRIKATDAAFEIYNNMPNQILVEAYYGDESATEEIIREVIYNFPPEYLQKKEITLNETPRKARFKLKEIKPE
jgi:hypothetical protein